MRLIGLGLTLALTACQSAAPLAQVPVSLPSAGPGKPLPANDQVISSILVASCLDEERPEPAQVLRSIARESANLLLMMGDNVYGDYDQNRKVRPDQTLTELRESFAQLASRADFQTVRKTHPVMVAWDDHDYGKNDGGSEFKFKEQAERIHERFWGLDKSGLAAWPGTYYAKTFGPPGKRVQVLMLDTRFFRSPLTRTDQRNAKGKERYIPSQAIDQQMLGEAQWKWLAMQLGQPAEVRIIGSSIQVLPTDGHGFESWSRLPDEQRRLLSLLKTTEATGVVLVSGDRHRAFMYRRQMSETANVIELTASSINRAFRPRTPERDSAQIGEAYAGENYGEVAINWVTSMLTLRIKNAAGETVRQVSEPFSTGRQ
ncbi:MAG: alkaline phosphatase D family protein [Burkholderiaceae bacterium]